MYKTRALSVTGLRRYRVKWTLDPYGNGNMISEKKIDKFLSKLVDFWVVTTKSLFSKNITRWERLFQNIKAFELQTQFDIVPMLMLHFAVQAL